MLKYDISIKIHYVPLTIPICILILISIQYFDKFNADIIFHCHTSNGWFINFNLKEVEFINNSLITV